MTLAVLVAVFCSCLRHPEKWGGAAKSPLLSGSPTSLHLFSTERWQAAQEFHREHSQTT